MVRYMGKYWDISHHLDDDNIGLLLKFCQLDHWSSFSMVSAQKSPRISPDYCDFLPVSGEFIRLRSKQVHNFGLNEWLGFVRQALRPEFYGRIGSG